EGTERQRADARGARAREAEEAERGLADAREQIAALVHGREAAREAALQHAEEMRLAQAVLAERDAYVAELERESRATDAVRAEAKEASARAEQAEARERA